MSDLISQREAAAIIGVIPHTLWNWRKRRYSWLPPVVMVNGHPYFERAAILAMRVPSMHLRRGTPPRSSEEFVRFVIECVRWLDSHRHHGQNGLEDHMRAWLTARDVYTTPAVLRQRIGLVLAAKRH